MNVNFRLILASSAGLALASAAVLSASEPPAGEHPTKGEHPTAKPSQPSPSSESGPKVGDAAPDWTLKTPDGKEVKLSALKGSVVVMDFWATWCGPCKAAMPSVQKLHEKYKEKGVQVYGLNTWEKDGDPAKYMKDQKYTYGLLLKADDVAKKYAVTGIPTFYIIGKDGKVIFTEVGFNGPESEKQITDAIDKVLADKPKG